MVKDSTDPDVQQSVVVLTVCKVWTCKAPETMRIETIDTQSGHIALCSTDFFAMLLRVFTQMTRRQNFDATPGIDRTIF